MALFIFKIMRYRPVLRVVAFLFNRFVLKKKVPALAVLAVTYQCQCHCAHCSAGLFKTRSPELSVEEWMAVIDALDQLGVPRVHITGGEPSIKVGVEKIVKHAVKKGMLTFFETNGVALTEDLVLRLKAAGVASINISLDHPMARVHDKLRGLEKCFEKALGAMALCRKHRMVFMVSTYATVENIMSGDLKKVVLLAQQERAHAIRIMPPQPSGRGLKFFTAGLQQKDKDSFRQQMPPVAILDRMDLPYCLIKSKYTLFVAPDGEVHPCPHLPFSFGNVRDIGIRGALDKMAVNPMFQKKSVCYINEAGFRQEFIDPLLLKKMDFPVKL